MFTCNSFPNSARVYRFAELLNKRRTHPLPHCINCLQPACASSLSLKCLFTIYFSPSSFLPAFLALTPSYLLPETTPSSSDTLESSSSLRFPGSKALLLFKNSLFQLCPEALISL